MAEASFAPKQAGGPWNLGHESVAAALRQADLVFGLNAADAECVLPLLTATDRWVPLAPFLDPAPYFRAAEQREKCRSDWSKRLGIDTGLPWILVVAMMRPGDKLASYRVLGEAMEMMKNQLWHLIVAGYGEAESAVRQALGGIGHRTSFPPPGPAIDLPSLYAACDIFAWPAVNEAYGMALLEAQSAGLPVVASDVGGVGGIVRDGETGLLIPEPDVRAFAEALGGLLNDEQKRRTFARRARARVRTHHTVECAARVLDRSMKTVPGDQQE